MSYGMDLHLHSYYSDGTRSPREVAKWAKEQGAVFVSLTDHADQIGRASCRERV